MTEVEKLVEKWLKEATALLSNSEDRFDRGFASGAHACARELEAALKADRERVGKEKSHE